MAIRKSHSSTTKGQRGRAPTEYKPPHFDREERTKYYGVQCCLAIFEHRRADIKRIFVTPEREEAFDHVLEWAERKRIPFKIAEYDELARVAATEHHEGVMIEARPLKLLAPGELVRKLTDLQRGLILLMEGVENPHNVGAILRTACFFGVNGVILQSQNVNSLSGAACRIAEGAAEHLPIAFTKDYEATFNALKNRGWSFVATTPHEARSMYSVKWANKVVLMFGAEGTGLSPAALESADVRVVVPRIGALESLNVSAAVASVLTEARREAIVKGHVRRVALK
jgi:TrmH RNA methyltransferase